MGRPFLRSLTKNSSPLDMIRVLISGQARYPVNRKLLREKVKEILNRHGVTSVSVSLSIVGKRKMDELSYKYLGEKEGMTHEVLAFPFNDPKNQEAIFINPPDEPLHLGDIVLCYPEIRDIAASENRLVDDIAAELSQHAALHLLGIHHD